MTPQEDIQKAREYINSAPTIEERSRRKMEMYHIIYNNRQSISEWVKKKEQEQKK